MEDNVSPTLVEQGKWPTRKWACPVLGCGFPPAWSLRGCDSHIRETHTKQAYHCSICAWSTLNLDLLQRHEKGHTTFPGGKLVVPGPSKQWGARFRVLYAQFRRLWTVTVNSVSDFMGGQTNQGWETRGWTLNWGFIVSVISWEGEPIRGGRNRVNYEQWTGKVGIYCVSDFMGGRTKQYVLLMSYCVWFPFKYLEHPFNFQS